MTQIEKTQFKNNTGGYIGVVVIGPRGDDRGAAVEPNGTVWLSEAEQRLTANAPRNSKDNPFIEQTLQRVNPENGELEDWTVVPLTMISEERYVPADARPIPATMSDHHALHSAAEAARGDEPTTVTDGRPTVESTTAAVMDREQERPTEPEEMVPEAPQPDPPAPPVQEAPVTPTEPTPEPPVLTPQGPPPPVAPQSPTPPEETAKVDPQVGEETGQATPPQPPPSQGEYQAGEEVGTPVEPQPPTDDTQSSEPQGSPAPWTGG